MPLQELQIAVAEKDVSVEHVQCFLRSDQCGPTMLAWISDLLSAADPKGSKSVLMKTGGFMHALLLTCFLLQIVLCMSSDTLHDIAVLPRSLEWGFRQVVRKRQHTDGRICKGACHPSSAILPVAAIFLLSEVWLTATQDADQIALEHSWARMDDMTCAALTELVVQILRRLMELSQKDQEKLEVLRRASNTIKRLPSGVTYPVRELQWLAVSGWNRGSIHCKFDRIQEASDFMTAALDLAAECPALANQIKVRLCVVLEPCANCTVCCHSHERFCNRSQPTLPTLKRRL